MTANIQEFRAKWMKLALIIGLVLLAIGIVFGFAESKAFFRAYLFSYMYWLGVALGCLGLTLVHQLTGGDWGKAIQPFMRASIRTIPFLTILFLPIVILGMHDLYEWTHEAAQHDHLIEKKLAYLNTPFFLIRAVIYFAVWNLYAWLLVKWERQYAETGDASLKAKLKKISGPGILLYAFTMTFASFDWMMSLRPHWFSSIYGMIVIAGQALTAFSFTIFLMSVFSRKQNFSYAPNRKQFWDLGKLLFALVVFWAYLSFSQLLLIWSANLPEETPWYLVRLNQPWIYLAVGLLIFHFALPFFVLLSRGVKVRAKVIGSIALAMLLIRFLDLFWLIAPEIEVGNAILHVVDFILPFALGGLWLAVFFFQLKQNDFLKGNHV